MNKRITYPVTLSVSCPQSPNRRLPERVEQKFFINPGRASIALGLLTRVCRPDPQFPDDQVNSLYFDTIGLDEHERSTSGDFVKDKVRIRWYGNDCDPHLTGDGPHRDTRDGHCPIPVWVELKSRRGFASSKQRIALTVPRSALEFAALKRGIVSPASLAQTMAGFGFFASRPLRPVVAISYQRHRFVEPATGFRVSIDSRIRSSMVMPAWGNGERGLELPGMVVEVKGPRFEVPASLRSLLAIGSSWTRYSKYSSSLDGHQAEMGSVARLWPTGMMEEQPY